MATRSSKSNGPARYALYCRCSSDDQAHKDYSTTEAQREMNSIHVQQQGGVVAEVYTDDGKSGTVIERPALTRLFRDAAAGKFDAVCITYMSRLGRGNAYVIAEYELKKSGVRVEIVREKFSDDIAGYVNKHMTNLMDGMYPKMVSNWTKTKQKRMVAKGYYCGGYVPFGYRTEVAEDGLGFHSSGKEPPKQLVPVEHDAEVVKRAYRLYLQTHSLARVRDYLATVTDRLWTTTKTKELLTREAYIGVQVFGPHRNESSHPGIVERSTWEAVQASLGQGSGSRAPRSDDYSYYLRGRIVCPYCGCPYTPSHATSSNGKRVHYYACLADQKRQRVCPVRRLNADSLHEAVLREIEHAATHPTVMHRIIKNSGGWQDASKDLLSFRGQLGKKKQLVEVHLGNINRAIAEGGSHLRSLLSSLQKKEQELSDICQEIADVEKEIRLTTVRRPTAEQVQSTWSKVGELWVKMTEQERTEVMGGLVKSVEAQEKDRVALELSPVVELHGPASDSPHSLPGEGKFEISSGLGAGARLELATFGL